MLDELFSKILRGDSLVFVGDLIYQGKEVPTYNDLSEELAAHFNCPEKSASLPRVSQLYEMSLGRQNLIATVKDIVQKKALSPLLVHHMLARLPTDIIITTNYDDLLEAAHEPGTYDVITTDMDVAYTTEERKVILRLRGRLDMPDTVVITEDDHYTFYNEKFPRITDFIRSHMAKRTPVFIGCDLDDPLLQQLYIRVSKGLGKHARRAYAVRHSVPEHVVRLWENRNLTHIQQLPEDALELILKRIPSDRLTSLDLISTASLSSPPDKEPFKFLSYFEESDADIFCGRKEVIARILSKIAYSQFVILHSQSGAGKTSLIKAGLVPQLISQGSYVAYMRAWRPPIEELVQVIRKHSQFKEFAENLLEGDALREVLDKISDNGYRLVVFLDQFEEFFLSTAISNKQREEFVDLLAYCTSGHTTNIHFVISLREDFLGELYDIQQKLHANYANLYRLYPLNVEQAIQAIVQPLAIKGKAISEDLVRHIISELCSEKAEVYPPQLQIICYKLYSSIPTNQDIITKRDLDAIGSVRSILVNYVNEVLRLFSVGQQEIAKAILKALITSHKTKVKLDQSGLAARLGPVAYNDEFQHVQRLLEAHRLLRKEEKDGRYFYELTHEYIIEKIDEWISVKEFATRRAQEFVEQEFYNWRMDSNCHMGKERFIAINEERGNILLSDEQKSFLLVAAIRESVELEYWIHQIPVPTAGLLEQVSRHIEEASPSIRRNAAVVMAFWNPSDVALTHTLKTLSELGNPHTLALLRLLQVPDNFLASLRKAISQRFSGRMVKIAAGDFIMGSTPEEVHWVASNFEIPKGWIEKEMPQSVVNVDDFFLDVYPVTNEEFQEFDATYQFVAGREKHPAVNINWFRAKAYAAWLGKDLPTEAEWEKAARGTDGRRFPWGDEFEPMRANSVEAGIGTTTPIGSYPSGVSPYGCNDMAGNVFEWTSTIVRPYPYNKDDGREEQVSQERRILRGGAYSYNSSLLRCALRYDYYAPTQSTHSLGFRCAIKGASIGNFLIPQNF